MSSFLAEYAGSLADADAAAVYYSPHALELKRLPPLPEEKIIAGFGKKGLAVIHQKGGFGELAFETVLQKC